jgi:hypothetical protein
VGLTTSLRKAMNVKKHSNGGSINNLWKMSAESYKDSELYRAT